MTPKEQCEALFDKLIGFAEELMKKHGEFYPFAAVLLIEDTVQLTASYDGADHPESVDVLSELTEIHKRLAEEGRIKASGIVWNAAVESEDGTPSDAIIVSLEHKDGYSIIVGEPYRTDADGSVKFGELFFIKGNNDIF